LEKRRNRGRSARVTGQKQEKEMERFTTALVTGATSGLGFEAAAQLADQGTSRVIITGRNPVRADEARVALVERTGKDVFETLTVDLDRSGDVKRAADELAGIGVSIDFLLLNAGMVSGSTLVKTDEDVEITFASSLIGHHEFTMRLLEDGVLSEKARIVIAGSEAARGDVPTFNPTDLGSLADKSFDGDRVAAAEGIIRADEPIKYKPATAYADAKLFVAWWSAQLAAKLPEGMTVNAVSPGSVPGTEAGRNANFFMKYVMLPAFKHAPKRFGMGAHVSSGAGRYIEVAGYDDDVSGEFFASAPKKMTGPIEAMQMPHIHDGANQEAAWSAVVKVAGGVDYPVNV
jgi:NAD(P)-dependent dehydrogenase (short-subunit alcohol dehydrogenase family)